MSRNCLNCLYREVRVGNGFELYCKLSQKEIKEIKDESTCPHMGGVNNKEEK